MPLAAPVIFITTGAVIAVRDLMLSGFQVVIFPYLACLQRPSPFWRLYHGKQIWPEGGILEWCSVTGEYSFTRPPYLHVFGIFVEC